MYTRRWSLTGNKKVTNFFSGVLVFFAGFAIDSAYIYIPHGAVDHSAGRLS